MKWSHFLSFSDLWCSWIYATFQLSRFKNINSDEFQVLKQSNRRSAGCGFSLCLGNFDFTQVSKPAGWTQSGLIEQSCSLSELIKSTILTPAPFSSLLVPGCSWGGRRNKSSALIHSFRWSTLTVEGNKKKNEGSSPNDVHGFFTQEAQGPTTCQTYLQSPQTGV